MAFNSVYGHPVPAFLARTTVGIQQLLHSFRRDLVVLLDALIHLFGQHRGDWFIMDQLCCSAAVGRWLFDHAGEPQDRLGVAPDHSVACRREPIMPMFATFLY